jgi:hypothetical protein
MLLLLPPVPVPLLVPLWVTPPPTVPQPHRPIAIVQAAVLMQAHALVTLPLNMISTERMVCKVDGGRRSELIQIAVYSDNNKES